MRKKQYIPESQLEPEDLRQENKRGFPPNQIKTITYEIEVKVQVVSVTESNTVRAKPSGKKK
jgi:hypothetical protein